MLSLEPLKAAPRYMWYLPGALPTKPISARNGRPHPFGQPVMRITMASSRSPAASTSASSWFSRPGRQRSLSARASPHVGSATHAIELSRKPVARRGSIQEKIHPLALIENLRTKQAQAELFADFNGIEFEQYIDFYHWGQKWTNRMILGDSLLVIASLAEKEGLKGKVQMIYM